MKITKEQIKLLDPCEDGYRWYLKEGTEDLLETLLKVNKVRSSWAVWLYIHLLSPNQNRRIAIFAAEQVLHIFENEYPDDKRPRLAIEAAKAVLLNDTEENRTKARKAGAVARAAAFDAYANASPDYLIVYSAVYADFVSDMAHSASTGSSYSCVNACVPGSVGQKIYLQELIIKEAVRILEEV